MYNLTITVNGKILDKEKPFPDPFLLSVVQISWWDRFTSLFRRKYSVIWKVDADDDTIFKTMNLHRLEIPKKWLGDHDLSSQ